MTEQVNVTESAEKAEFSDDHAEMYLAAYLKDIGLEDPIETVSPYHRQIMADIPLMMQRVELPVVPKPHTDREKTLAFFNKQNWVPRQKQEANIAALKHVEGALKGARKSKNPDGAQLGTRKTIKRYYDDALADTLALNRVRIPSENYAADELDAHRLRQSRPALYVLADTMMAREFLVNDDWPNSNWPQYKDRQNYWRGFMLFAANHATDEALRETFDYFLPQVTERQLFWSRQYSLVNSKVGHLAVKDDVSEGPVISGDIPQTSAPETDYESLLPPDVREHLRKRRAAFEARFDDLSDKGMPEAEKKARIQREFPEFVPGADVEHQEVAQILVKRSKSPPAAARSSSNPANSPYVRSQIGYDKRTDK